MTSDLPNMLYIMNYTIITSTLDYRYDTVNIVVLEQWYNTHNIHHEPVFVATMRDLAVGYATYCQFGE